MDYRNAAECLNLLQRLHPMNVEETHAALSIMVVGMLEALPPPNQHLEVLEAARAMIGYVQGEFSRRYATHPLPPDSLENETLLRVVTLWRNLARSYARIARHDAHDGTLDDQRALLFQRRLFYAGQAVIEFFRAHRAVQAGLWAELHESYAAADAAHLARIRVADAQNEVWKAQSTLEAYAAVLLVDLANPYGRTERELAWVCRWAQRFAPYCDLDLGTEPQKPNMYGLDLGTDEGLRPLGLLAQSSRLHRFDGSKLAGQIQAVLTQFKQGVKPSSLGLGEDCSTEACARLLLSLYRPWGLAAAGRRFPRRGSRGEVELSCDWLAIGFHVNGKVFEQPRLYGQTPGLNSDISLLTFGERVAAADNPARAAQRRQREAEELGFVCERWEVVDQSVGGFRLQQRPRAERLEHHQLVGVRPQDSQRFLLGHISWLMFRADGILEAGAHILAGLPSLVAVRSVGLHSGRAPFHQGFLLPATPALKTEASLVVPSGWYHAKGIVEVFQDGTLRQLRMMQLMLKGANFDQVSFEPVVPSAASAAPAESAR